MQRTATPRGDAYRLGYDTLGPVFAAFALLLVRVAARRGIRRLIFLARDGDLLRLVTSQLLQSKPMDNAPELTYVRVSRQVAALAALRTLDAGTFRAAHAVAAGEPSLRKSLEFFGLDSLRLAPWLDRHGLVADGFASEADMARLLGDGEFQSAVALQAQEQRSLLGRYLVQEGALSTAPLAWVDIGWRGSIQRHLTAALGLAGEANASIGLYFALWNENGPAPAPGDAVGLIGDQRRGRNVLEGSPWYAAHLLEAVCRADEGTTTGFGVVNGRITPRLLEDGHRLAEIASTDLASQIRAGIVARVQALASDPEWHLKGDGRLRRSAQRSLLRLAFFPSAEVIEIGRRLVHTEGHAKGWNVPLILPGPSPWRSPRGWLAGLASPWRAGYVAATGGLGTAALFALFEAIFSILPARFHGWIANAAKRLAGNRVRARL